MKQGFATLSNREKEVAQEVTKGESNKAIAAKLFVTEKTVKFHLTNIYKKVGVKSRAQLIVDSIKHGWAPRPEILEDAPTLPGESIVPSPPESSVGPSEDTPVLPGTALR